MAKADMTAECENPALPLVAAILKVSDYRQAFESKQGQGLGYGLLGGEFGIKKRSMFSWQDIRLFIKNFEKMLRECRSGLATGKVDFVDLFQAFARIFSVHFKILGQWTPGKNSNVKKYCMMRVGGTDVISVPDLLYDMMTADKCCGTSVVTVVGEVKPTAKKRGDETRSKEMPRECCHSDDNTDPDEPPRKRHCPELDVEFPSRLRGQHATQLLFHQQYTSLKNQDCILGMVVQATKVRLTCLEVNKKVFELLDKEDGDEIEKKPRSNIYYTRAFDMFSRKERAILIHILVTLAKYNNDAPIE